MSSVLITGAAKGIGRATAIEFAKRGYRVVATDVDPGPLRSLNVDQCLRLDVTDPDSVEEAIAAAGKIDILLSNAGGVFLGAVEACPVDEIQRLFTLNTFGGIRVAQAVLPQMRARGSGRLLFMSSLLGRVAPSGNAAYAATKWALEAFVEALAAETAPFGVRTTMFEPGVVSSGALDNPLTYRLAGDPYAGALATDSLGSAGSVSPQYVAQVVADIAELKSPPLRVPVGEIATAVLAQRKAAPDDAPFLFTE
jgi:NAD(P)-dependent dehydrogenase (short-subunit alcohol dehydrogenase family)